MLSLVNELRAKEALLTEKLMNLSTDHMIIAKRAKMTLCEIVRCLEICEKCSLSRDIVFSKMAAFKESSAFLIYNEDFSIA